MESNWAAEHLQTIRTLMERSALYRRALAPIMIFVGALGLAGGAAGWMLPLASATAFVGFWIGLALAGLAGSFFLVRRQALRAAEPFWSPPTRRVAQGLVPPLFIGAVAGLLALAGPRYEFVPPAALPALWMLLYGCALHAAGFFMARGIRWLGWLFVLGGCALMAARACCGTPASLVCAHQLMGASFGGLHLAYGLYLYFTEPRENEP